MAARDERRAVLALALVATLGGAIRVLRSPGGPPGAPLVAPHLQGADVVRQAARARRAEALQRPLLPGERVDVDRADADELQRLPRVGATLARRIVEDRDAQGPFGSLDGLGRVAGIGPGLRQALERWVSFSGVARSPPPGPVAPPRPSAPPVCGAAPVALNTATAAELDCLKGLGPALAARIVADRGSRGPFGSVQELERVPGIGKRLVERLRPYLRAP
jgi:competence ComEA-like helix-hairpin-helix protein